MSQEMYKVFPLCRIVFFVKHRCLSWLEIDLARSEGLDGTKVDNIKIEVGRFVFSV